MKWSQLSEAVYVANSNIVKVDAQDITLLKENIAKTPDQRIRICVHQKDDLLHEMIIAIKKGSYIRPHKHLNKSESFHMIEGEMDVIIFDDVGEIIEVIPMGKIGSGKNFFYRLSAPYFHTLHLRTPLVVFHETTNGPFRKEETIMAPWSPEPEELKEVQTFLAKIEECT